VVDRTLPATDAELNELISEIIEDAGLRRPRNAYFQGARHAESVAPAPALGVAVQWQELTKAFMFTTMASIGVKARECHLQADPDREMLGALQTAFSVIGDDFANFAPLFRETAPSGVAGIHYLWWADTVVAPLAALLPEEDVAAAAELPDGVRALHDNMGRLASSPLGAAVQLRLVEDIAMDLAVAFRRTFAKVRMGDVAPFAGAGALEWMDTHIKAETMHAASVTDEEAGPTLLATTPEERATFLHLITEYAANWARALDDFATAFDRQAVPAGADAR
jgi:hypothetical protein